MPINNKYSKRFHKLVHCLLQKNPLKRLNSNQLFEKVSVMLNKLSTLESTLWNCSTIKDIYASESLREYIKRKRSVTYVASELVVVMIILLAVPAIMFAALTFTS